LFCCSNLVSRQWSVSLNSLSSSCLGKHYPFHFESKILTFGAITCKDQQVGQRNFDFLRPQKTKNCRYLIYLNQTSILLHLPQTVLSHRYSLPCIDLYSVVLSSPHNFWLCCALCSQRLNLRSERRLGSKS